jgi:hypothetical protein
MTLRALALRLLGARLMNRKSVDRRGSPLALPTPSFPMVPLHLEVVVSVLCAREMPL